MLAPITHTYGASHIWTFKKDSRRSKTLSQLRVEEVKTLPLDGYWTMLNTEPLGEEVVPFFSIVFFQ